jgi:hypothetical protein
MDSEADIKQVLDFVRAQFKHFLGMEPTIFAVSNKKAMIAKLGNIVFLNLMQGKRLLFWMCRGAERRKAFVVNVAVARFEICVFGAVYSRDPFFLRTRVRFLPCILFFSAVFV